jgi:hypothetical protein
MTGSGRMLASFTLADAVVVALAIATAFLLGLWCGRVWRRRTWSHAADDLKRRAQRG